MTTLTPLGPRILVRPIEPVAEIDLGDGKKLLIPEKAREAPHEGEVEALGIGSDEDGKPYEFTVKVGDKVLMAKHAEKRITINSREVFVIEEKNVLAIIE